MIPPPSMPDPEDLGPRYRVKYVTTRTYLDRDYYTKWTDPDWGPDADSIQADSLEELYLLATQAYHQWRQTCERMIHDSTHNKVFSDRKLTMDDFKIEFGEIVTFVADFDLEYLKATPEHRGYEAILTREQGERERHLQALKEEKKATARAKREENERAELARLAAKYGAPDDVDRRLEDRVAVEL